MRFLADENCDEAVIRALRADGHDVALVRERIPGAEDVVVTELAVKERRIVLTEDKDFGQLAQALSAGGVGVVLIRFPTQARSTLGSSVAQAVSLSGSRLERAFTVIEPGQVRSTSFEP
jgi:predicted nuclease of predicted toxin-antitoxin system